MLVSIARIFTVYFAFCQEARSPSRLLKKHEILASSFDRLRMRSRVFNGLALMVSLSNHG